MGQAKSRDENPAMTDEEKIDWLGMQEYLRAQAITQAMNDREKIEAGAGALRQHMQGGKQLAPWLLVPIGRKKKWRECARIVLVAAKAIDG
jgi:hypothetical protein